MSSKIFSIIIILFSLNLQAFENDFVLKVGASGTYSSFNTRAANSSSSFGPGVNTNFGYKWTSLEFDFTSNIIFGRTTDLSFAANGIEVSGDARFRKVTFGPNLKYLTPYKIYKNWQFFMGGGPIWSIQTYKFSEYKYRDTTFKDEYQIVSLARGGQLSIGFEEDMKFKEMHQVFIELSALYENSYEVAISDTSDFKQVKTLNQDHSDQGIDSWTIIVAMGMTIF